MIVTLSLTLTPGDADELSCALGLAANQCDNANNGVGGKSLLLFLNSNPSYLTCKVFFEISSVVSLKWDRT